MTSCTKVLVEPQRSARRIPHVSLALCFVALLVFAWSPWTDALQYDRAAVAGGEYWRIATCQWTHWNLSHLVWDALMFFALGALCESVRRSTFVACVALSAVLVPLACAVALPEMRFYRGLSGLDSALFVLLTVQLIQLYWSRDRVLAVVAGVGLVGFVVKTIYECVTGSIIFVQPEFAFAPVPLAHVVGGAIGLAIAARGGSREHNDQRVGTRAVEFRRLEQS